MSKLYVRGCLNFMWNLVAIFFGLENLAFLAKSDIWFPKCTKGEASTGLENFPKFYHFFWRLPWAGLLCNVLPPSSTQAGVSQKTSCLVKWSRNAPNLLNVGISVHCTIWKAQFWFIGDLWEELVGTRLDELKVVLVTSWARTQVRAKQR